MVSFLGECFKVISDDHLVSLVGNEALINLLSPPLQKLLQLGRVGSFLSEASGVLLLVSSRKLLLL
jgi:hypothetical protein